MGREAAAHGVGSSITTSEAQRRVEELELLLQTQEQETLRVKDELENCKEDLQRDEEIFNEKMKEIRALKSYQVM